MSGPTFPPPDFPYGGGIQGQSSPWGRNYGGKSPRHFDNMQRTPQGQNYGTPYNRSSPGYCTPPGHMTPPGGMTPPFTPQFSPINQNHFYQSYSNTSRSSFSGGSRSGSWNSSSPYKGGYSSERRGTPQFHCKERQSFGGRSNFQGRENGGIHRYFKQTMLEDPWSELMKDNANETNNT